MVQYLIFLWSLVVAVGRSWRPQDSCDQSVFERQLVERGLSDAEVAAVREVGLVAVDDLLKSWSTEAAHVVFLGDSLMHQLHKVIYCGAVARFCQDLEEPKAPTLVHMNGSMTKGGDGDATMSIDRATKDEIASILTEQNLACGDGNGGGTRRITLTLLKWYELVDDTDEIIASTSAGSGGGGRYPFSMTTTLLRDVLRTIGPKVTHLVANIGHAGLNGPTDAAKNTTAILLQLATTKGIFGSAEPITVLLGHPPQHFPTYGGIFPGYAHVDKIVDCACQRVADLRPQLTHVENLAMAVLTKTFVVNDEDSDDCRAARIAVTHNFWIPMARHACRFHRTSADCTHYIPTPSIYAPLISDLASTTRFLTTSFRYCHHLHTPPDLRRRFVSPSPTFE